MGWKKIIPKISHNTPIARAKKIFEERNKKLNWQNITPKEDDE